MDIGKVDAITKKYMQNPEVFADALNQFLSGFHKGDKLLPVITLVIYWGAEEWDAPVSLSEMYAQVDAQMSKYLPDYKLNLIAPKHMTEEEINGFQTSLKEVLLFIKYSKDKQKLKKLTTEDKEFMHLDHMAVDVLNVVTKADIKYLEGEEAVDVCLAIKEIMEDSKSEGMIEGRLEGRLEGRAEEIIFMGQEDGLSKERIVSKLMKRLEVSQEKAEEYYEKYSVDDENNNEASV